MKKLSLIFFLAVMMQGVAQKQFTKTGKIDFEASVPAFEPVKASHSAVTAVLDLDTGEFAALALIKGFRFRNALMEEHFNENYMDSDTYPKAVFKGNLKDFSKDKLSGGTQSFTIEGTLEVRGKTQPITTEVTLSGASDTLHLESKFSVSPGDFDIEIPSVVSDKISDKISINVVFDLQKK